MISSLCTLEQTHQWLCFVLVLDGENATENEAPKTDSSPEAQEASIVEPVGSILGKISTHEKTIQKCTQNRHLTSLLLGSNKELKALIEKEVREQMMHVSGHLDQQMKNTADQQERLPESRRGHKNKK